MGFECLIVELQVVGKCLLGGLYKYFVGNVMVKGVKLFVSQIVSVSVFCQC